MSTSTATTMAASAELSAAGRVAWMAAAVALIGVAAGCWALQANRDGALAAISAMTSAIALMCGGLLLACSLTGRPPGGPPSQAAAEQPAAALDRPGLRPVEVHQIARRQPVGGDTETAPAQRTQP